MYLCVHVIPRILHVCLLCILIYLQHEMVIAQDRKQIQQLDNNIDKVLY